MSGVRRGGPTLATGPETSGALDMHFHGSQVAGSTYGRQSFESSALRGSQGQGRAQVRCVRIPIHP